MKPIAYLQSVYTELRKVSWPTWMTVVQYFIAVVLGVAIATAIIYAFDFLFLRGLALIIN